MGKTINQLTGEVTDPSNITEDAEMEIQLDGETTTKKVKMSVLVAAVEALMAGGLTPLITPTLTATMTGAFTVTLDWSNIPDETGFVLQRSPNGVGWTTIATLAANVITFPDTGLTPSTLYYYRVKGIGDGVTFADSAYGSTTITTDAPPAFPHISLFTGADGTLIEDYVPDSGYAWTPAGGTLEIQSNKITPKLPIPVGNSVSAFTALGVTQDFVCRVVCQLDDVDTYIPIMLRGNLAGSLGINLLILHASVYCIDTAAGSTSFGVIALTSSFAEREVKFTLVGNLLTTHVDGVLIDSDRVFDAANNGTLVRIGQLNVATVTSRINSIKCEAS